VSKNIKTRPVGDDRAQPHRSLALFAMLGKCAVLVPPPGGGRTALAAENVDLVEEDDGGGTAAGGLEERPHQLLGLPAVLGGRPPDPRPRPTAVRDSNEGGAIEKNPEWNIVYWPRDCRDAGFWLNDLSRKAVNLKALDFLFPYKT